MKTAINFANVCIYWKNDEWKNCTVNRNVFYEYFIYIKYCRTIYSTRKTNTEK